MRVLLTGSSGFIGATLAGHLRSARHDVIGLDLRPGPATTLDCDLRDPAMTCISAGQTDVFIHFAALAGVGPSLLDPLRYMEANVTGTLHALQLAAHLNARRVIFASSSSVYGRVDGPAQEDRAPAPLSPDAESKVAAEALCRDFAAKGAFDVVVLRPFTVYGPGQRPDMFCHQALTKTIAGEELQVWRWQRDFTFVDEVCVATVNATRVPVPDGLATYNLGSGRPVDVSEFLATVEAVTGRAPVAVFGEARPCEPELTSADTTRSREELDLPLPLPFFEGLLAQYRAMGT